jgi:hypothetical protein
MFVRPRTVLLLSAIALSSSASRAAETIHCSCLFEQSSGYVGQGTRSACSTFTEKNKGSGETCQIAFGGTGYQEQQVSRLKLDPKEYRAKVFSMTMFNLAAVRDRAPDKFVTNDFLRDAIPIYMRAVYLRAENRLDDGTLADLDREVTSVSAEYAGPIADVFLGKAQPFETTWHDRHRLSVQRGAIKFVYAERINLVTVFFDPEDRQ